MRIRSIHPEFYRSEDVAAMDWHTRLVFIGLWSYVDDNGVGRDVEKLIVADLYPLEDDPRESLARVSDALATLSDGGQITRYTVDGKPFLYVTAWNKWQKIDKPGKQRYPLPTCENAAVRESVARVSRDSSETPAPGEGEKGRRGEGEKKNIRPAEPDTFDEWWTAYPRREGKGRAKPAYAKATRTVPADKLLRLTAEWFAARPDLEPRFIPLPASWLNARRWEDEPPSQIAHPAAPSPWDRKYVRGDEGL